VIGSKFEVERFLSETWQKKPILIKNPWPSWSNPLDPDELAGLACQDGVAARLITCRPDSFAVEHGPFAEDRFAEADTNPWTLLVQAVDHHVPDVSALLGSFRFIPNWRIDDVMVSYATDRGGVGPHFDQYDVFLIQGLGRRRWQIGAMCDERTELLPNEDLRLLAHFEPTDEWVLDPGDILYVPPGVAHNGIAIGEDCMTYSIGFRAPSRGDLITGWSEHITDQLDESDRYADPALVLQDNPGEITAEALSSLHAIITDKLNDRREFARWFGQHVTIPKDPEIDWTPDVAIEVADLRALACAPACLVRNPASRFAFVREDADGVTLYVDGQSFACSDESARFAERCCASHHIPTTPEDVASGSTAALIVALVNLGCIEIADAD
jgi:50S ribosomal protein L16 3-hydroxylase